MCVWQGLWGGCTRVPGSPRPEEGTGSSEARVTDAVKQLIWVLGTKLWASAGTVGALRH